MYNSGIEIKRRNKLVMNVSKTKIFWLIVFFFRVLSPTFASIHLHDASKISIENGAIGYESVKAWEKLLIQGGSVSDILRKDIKTLE